MFHIGKDTKTVFSLDDLTKRWGFSKSTIKRMEENGMLCRLHLPGVTYRSKEVYELEGFNKTDWTAMTPFEKQRLVSENVALTNEVNKLKSILFNISSMININISEELARRGQL